MFTFEKGKHIQTNRQITSLIHFGGLEAYSHMNTSINLQYNDIFMCVCVCDVISENIWLISSWEHQHISWVGQLDSWYHIKNLSVCLAGCYRPQVPSDWPDDTHAVPTHELSLGRERSSSVIDSVSYSQIHSKYAVIKLTDTKLAFLCVALYNKTISSRPSWSASSHQPCWCSCSLRRMTV